MAIIRYKQKNKPYAQRLRREMTKQERHLWYDFLRKLPVQVRRQKQFGDYIVDFYCSSAKLVIELDGSQHYEEFGPEYDRRRDAYLRSIGLTVERFDNIEIDKNCDNVCAYLWKRMECGDVPLIKEKDYKEKD